MKISIITVVYNNVHTIEDCIKSVLGQTWSDLEYIIIDGGSTDGTLELINRSARGARIVSEPDKGIYDAMNKGIALATGDVVGILNSDDFYVDDRVIEKVAAAFDTLAIDALFADLVYVRPDKPDKIVRYYSGADFTLDKFAAGWTPPHPTFFVRRECYLKWGLFKTDYKIAADFDLMARLLVKHGIRYHYLPEVIIKMRTGGVSTRSFYSNMVSNREMLRACAENGIATNRFKIYSRFFTKCMQLFARPK
ncbi:MAG: glycosyltransferase family 2 protein [Elusimicrobia bacterium]|nr:glycosyltransferase family 2 protein [Elusimicrobiota bacterium]